MSKATQSAPPVYELKHRVTGAAILVILAVVIIPLFLSEPSLEANSNARPGEPGYNKTFKSRIVPLNINNVNGNDSGNDQLPVATLDDKKPALLDLTNQSQAPQPKAEIAEKAKSSVEKTTKTALVMTQNPVTTQPVSKIESEKKVEPEKPKASQEKSKPSSNNNETKVANLEQQDNQAGGGWIVRVGTFSKQANVDSVSSLLDNSGFKPKTTGVTTSLGESTRVWLGPYAKRETADKISDRLKDLIGEKGYVTRTSS